jgi:hypothetical protein
VTYAMRIVEFPTGQKIELSPTHDIDGSTTVSLDLCDESALHESVELNGEKLEELIDALEEMRGFCRP